MTMVVTGATGFVGSAVVRALLARGDSVRVTARDGANLHNLADLDVEIVKADLLDPESLTGALRGAKGLYHVAADYRLWMRDPKPMYMANVEGTKALMQAALTQGIERIVYCSSVAVLGLHSDGKPATEETPSTLDNMIGPYKKSKFLAEEVVRQMIAEQGLPCVIVNPSTPIGPRDIKPTPTGRMIVEAASGKMPAFVDTGLNVVHVDDVASGHLKAFDQGRVGERYILGGENLSLASILRIVAETVGAKPPTIAIPHNAIMPIAWAAEAWARITKTDKEPFVTIDGLNMAKKKMFFDAAKAKNELGFDARPARQAIEDAIEWFRQEGYLSGGTPR